MICKNKILGHFWGWPINWSNNHQKLIGTIIRTVLVAILALALHFVSKPNNVVVEVFSIDTISVQCLYLALGNAICYTYILGAVIVTLLVENDYVEHSILL